MTNTATMSDLVKGMNVIARAVADAMGAVARAAQAAWRTLQPLMPYALARARAIHGGNRTDAYAYPEAWMSTVCGAWLCRGGEGCPSDSYGLRCTCRCHTNQREREG
jgi:hypothetical protein